MHIKSMVIGVVAGSVLALAGCGKGGGACAPIEKKICAGKDDAFCKKAKDAFWKQTGPDGKVMAKSDVESFCKMMADDKDLDAWVTQFQATVK